MLKKIWKGFSWIEIAAALLLFAVVVGLTLPNFPKYRCLAKQSEAKFELMRIVSAAELFKIQSGRYPDLPELLSSGRLKLRKKNYDYEIILHNAEIVVIATGKSGTQVQNDRWKVDKNKNLENLQDSCLNL